MTYQQRTLNTNPGTSSQGDGGLTQPIINRQTSSAQSALAQAKYPIFPLSGLIVLLAVAPAQ